MQIKMKKFIYLCTLLAALQSCKKEAFDYSIYQPQVSDIDSIAFFTGSPSLIADGKASLQFVLEAFRKVQIKASNGQLKDTMMFVDYRALPSSEVRFYADGQLTTGAEFSTSLSSKASLEFYAQIGQIKSKVKTVKILKPIAVAEKRYVDVIFHVFELSTTDPAYDALTYQEVPPKYLQAAIEYANLVFSNSFGKDPNGAAAGIEFRLAKTNASGGGLAVPGYNKIIYDASWKASPTANFVPANFWNKVNSTVGYQWNKDKFLNIYVMPSSANNSIGNNRAAYQIVPAGQAPLQGITNTVNSAADVPTNDFYTNYGLGVHRTVFFPGADRKIEIASYLGLYYGLYRGTDAADYVSDTRKYSLTGNNQKDLLKVGLDGEKFLANNAMDDIRYGSLRNCFTQGQVNRMRLVMDRSPVRKSWFLN